MRRETPWTTDSGGEQMVDQIVTDPTYMEHIRHFFDDVDLEHMLNRGVDLTTYPALRAEATRVRQVTRPLNATTPAFMPPEPERTWSPERIQTFRNWIVNGFPLGVPTPQVPQADTGTRIRKDARDLSPDEITTLGQAFQGMMDRDPDNETSYFHLAGLHWFPVPSECQHHVDAYHAWHRAFLQLFEDALRSVPGCADVTIPFWDITAAPPEFLFAPPFDSYTLPLAVHANYPAGYQTSRFPSADIMSNVALFEIPANIDFAMTQFDWATFTSAIEGGGHDNGHVATGPTLSTPDVASFDPLFWLFHSNWDRLWWEWQQIMQATTKWSFRSTITTGDTEFLTDPFDTLSPFTPKTGEVIDLIETGAGYALSATPIDERVLRNVGPAAFGSAQATRRLRVRSAPVVSVRLKGVDRLVIPGSFLTTLTADGEPLARQAFFQSTEPRDCGRCRERAKVDITFTVPAEAVLGKNLEAGIEVVAPGAERIGARFPLSRCGDPTLNVRLLLEESP
jgi:hypothetical protein